MIPVQLQSEPEDFFERVTKDGKKFLLLNPQPTSQEWKGKEYWQRALPDMRQAYQRVCAYCCHWIPHSTGSHSIDHFVPKSQQPDLAYDWANFRYVSSRFNSRKGTKAILDPFKILNESFIIDFSSFLIHPNSDLSPDKQVEVRETIKCLKLNSDDDLVTERQTYFFEYQTGEISFEHLEKRAPFIAYEVLRQGKKKYEIKFGNIAIRVRIIRKFLRTALVIKSWNKLQSNNAHAHRPLKKFSIDV